jgi:hypothetical protein
MDVDLGGFWTFRHRVLIPDSFVERTFTVVAAFVT